MTAVLTLDEDMIAFKAVWILGEGFAPAAWSPLGPHWERTLTRCINRGVSIDDLKHLAIHAIKDTEHADSWRYFCQLTLGYTDQLKATNS